MAADNTNLTPIAFGGTNSMSTPKALNSTAIFDSDAVTFSADATDCYLQVKVDNQGTPGSGDVVDVYLRVSLDGGTTYDTDEHMSWVMRLDTYPTNTPGEDPANRTSRLRTAAKAFKSGVSCPIAASRNIGVRARVITHRPQ